VQPFGSTAEPSFLKDREPDNALGYVEPNAIGCAHARTTASPTSSIELLGRPETVSEYSNIW
jgi:hypothetical protein